LGHHLDWDDDDPAFIPPKLRLLTTMFANTPPRLVLGEQLGRRPPAGLILEINIRKRPAAVVTHDKARF
jgi:hypothetical protein